MLAAPVEVLEERERKDETRQGKVGYNYEINHELFYSRDGLVICVILIMSMSVKCWYALGKVAQLPYLLSRYIDKSRPLVLVPQQVLLLTRKNSSVQEYIYRAGGRYAPAVQSTFYIQHR